MVSAPLAGGEPTTLASGQESPNAIAVDDDYVYWLDMGHQTGSETVGLGFFPAAKVDVEAGTGSVVRVAKSGGQPETLASHQDWPSWRIVPDATGLYWLNSVGPLSANATGAVMRLPPGGGEPITLAREQNHPWSLAVSQGALYWGVGPFTYGSFAGGLLLSTQELDTPQNRETFLRLTIP